MGELILDGIGIVIDAAADSIAGVVNGEGIDLEKEKERAKSTIDKLMEKTDEYIDIMVDAVNGEVDRVEGTIEKDIHEAKDVKEELKKNYHSLKEN